MIIIIIVYNSLQYSKHNNIITVTTQHKYHDYKKENTHTHSICNHRYTALAHQPYNKLLQQAGSQMQHRCCPLANMDENINPGKVSASPSMPPKCPFPRGIWPPPNTYVLGRPHVHIPNGILIGSAIPAQITPMTNRHTDRQRYSTSNRPHLTLCTLM